MNYFNYAIKCIIRNIIYKLMKPKVFISLLIGIIATFFLANYTTVFGWEGDNSYTDKNATIIMQYDSINQDLLNRIKYFTGNSTNIDNIIAYLKNNNYSYYCFYGASNGASMDTSAYYNTEDLWVYFYSKSNLNSSGSICEMYQGMITNYRYIEGALGPAFVFTGDSISTWTPQAFHIPSVLINYKSPILYSYINSDDAEQTNSIVGAINNQTNSINQQTNTIQQQTQVIQETQDFVTNSTVSDNTMSVDTSSYSVTDSGVNNFFTSFLNTVSGFFNNIDTSVESVSFPIPFTEQSVILYSNMVSKHIENTAIFTVIQVFWWYVIGRYIIMFVYRMVQWLSDGEIAEKGVFSFANWLDNYNTIIKSYMM